MQTCMRTAPTPHPGISVAQADSILDKAKAALGLASDKAGQGAAAAEGAARTAGDRASANYDAAKRSTSGATAAASDQARDAYQATKGAAVDAAGSASQQVEALRARFSAGICPSVMSTRCCDHVLL